MQCPRRSVFARLILREWFASVILSTGRRPVLLSLQLFIVSGLFGAIALGTLKAIIRFAHQQTPGDFECLLATLFNAFFKARNLLQPYGNVFDQ
jgi:hypothetical protein